MLRCDLHERQDYFAPGGIWTKSFIFDKDRLTTILDSQVDYILTNTDEDQNIGIGNVSINQ